jgi:type 1 fimbria pilin
MILMLTSRAYATDQNISHVNITGSIVGAACSINLGSPDQTVNIGNHPISEMLKLGRGPNHFFSIALLGCKLYENDTQQSEMTTMKLMFDGEEDAGHFKVLGSASGIAIMISDHHGNLAIPGKHLTQSKLSSDMQFNYRLNLIGNQDVIRSGNLHLTLRFRIDYN